VQTKLTLRLEADVIRRAKAYARRRGKSVSTVVADYFATLRAAEARTRTLAGGALDADVTLAIRSPSDGTVRAVKVIAGQSVPQGAALFGVAVLVDAAGNDTYRAAYAGQAAACLLSA
jgi:multidrug resistance efflux pump